MLLRLCAKRSLSCGASHGFSLGLRNSLRLASTFHVKASGLGHNQGHSMTRIALQNECTPASPPSIRYLLSPAPPTRRVLSSSPNCSRHSSKLEAVSPTSTKPVVQPSSAEPFVPPPSWLDKLPQRLRWTRPYFDLARLDKPIGSWLLYWPCAWSITMAAYSTSFPVSSTIYQLLLFGTGAVVMRGAGCTINDLWDRDIDDKVARTRLRPLAAKTVTPFQALQFLGLQLSVGLAVLTQLNWYSIFLGAASLSVVVIYPLMKRITYWPQFVLGLAFNWGALLGSSAVLGYCNWAVALPLYAGSIAWTLVYDTIYAHQDKADDIHASVKSTALLFGDSTIPVLSAFSVTYLSLLSYAGYLNGQGLSFYAISVLGGAAHLFWQLKGLKINDRADCWMRFKANRDFGAIVFAGLWVDYLAKMLL